MPEFANPSAGMDDEEGFYAQCAGGVQEEI